MSNHENTDSFYKPLAVESLLAGHFPPVALYLNHGAGNFILYKPHNGELTEKDMVRLSNNDNTSVYIRTGDVEIVAAYLEQQADTLFRREDISSGTKERILALVSFNYLCEVFRKPELIADVTRCKALLGALLLHAAGRESLMKAVLLVIGGQYQLIGHSIDVAVLTMRAHRMILDVHGDEVLNAGVGALFHDAGIIRLSSNSLEGAYPFTGIDYSRVKLHPQAGYDLLRPMWGDAGAIALDMVRYHHEKCDGSGYPHRLPGGSIPRSAQILSICDVYSSLTTDRTFRKATTPERTLDIMASEAGIFNREFLDAFRSMILDTR
ncbi:MAG: HD-GYP domain-containing protein [Desulfuromonadaceae bacterium]